MGVKPPRDPARIEPLLMLLYEVWSKEPDLRLSQLLVNAIRPKEPCPQIFSVEDDVLEKGLRRILEQMNTSPQKAQHGS